MKLKPLNFKHFILVLVGSVALLSNNISLANPCPHCDDLREDCLLPRAGAGGATGKWADEITPKRGWACTGATDMGSDNLVECEMCEREHVRYVHHMTHGTGEAIDLDVGCICAGHMEGRWEDEASIEEAIGRARDRTRRLVNRSSRRNKFPDLAAWKISKKGNPTIKRGKTWVTILRGKYGGHSAMINRQLVGGWVNTVRLAKLAAFDYLYPAQVQ